MDDGRSEEEEVEEREERWGVDATGRRMEGGGGRKDATGRKIEVGG